MTDSQIQPEFPPPDSRPTPFGLRTALLVLLVLASSLAAFDFWRYEPGHGANVLTADRFKVGYLPPHHLSLENQRKILRVGACSEAQFSYQDAPYGEVPGPKWRDIAALAVWVLSVCWLLVHAVRSRQPSSRSSTAPVDTELPGGS